MLSKNGPWKRDALPRISKFVQALDLHGIKSFGVGCEIKTSQFQETNKQYKGFLGMDGKQEIFVYITSRVYLVLNRMSCSGLCRMQLLIQVFLKA